MGMPFYEQVHAPLVVPHKHSGDLHHDNTTCQLLVDMQKHEVVVILASPVVELRSSLELS